MGRDDTFYGACHINLGAEIERVIKELERLGFQNITKLEASDLIAERSKRFSMNNKDVMNFMERKRGLV
ncbi:unnamed protein product [marine sediment metagenome]|uniref:Uncharacterized protein n=1 Tax=marine sediment metagenome TaxID=412755 RepID=X1D2J5_9ZZZZ